MDTYGWDTVSLTTLENANKSIASSSSQLITTFDLKDHNADYDIDTHIQGTFGNWQITEGGAGKLLYLVTPIKSGTLTLSGPNAKLLNPTGNPVDLSGLSVVLEISLQFLPSKSKTDQHDLCFHFTRVGTTPGDTTPGVVTPRSLLPEDADIPGAVKPLIALAVASCLVAHADSVSYIFATVNPVGAGANSWLAPKQWDYVSLKPVAEESMGYLAILSVTDDRDISGLQRNVDPALLAGSAASFAIGQDLFMENVIRPALPVAFGHGTDLNTFVYNPSTHTISNTRAFPTDSAKVGAITYDPSITGVSARIQDNAVVTGVNGTCDLYMGIHMSFGLQASSPLTFSAADKTLAFQPDPHPLSNHHVSIPWYDYLIGGIAGVIGAILNAVLLPLIAHAIGSGIAGSTVTAAKLSIAKNPPQFIQWAGLERFDVSDAGLSGCFYMRGNLS